MCSFPQADALVKGVQDKDKDDKMSKRQERVPSISYNLNDTSLHCHSTQSI